MFSSDSRFSWLLSYQHLALSSCSAQCILESFSGKKKTQNFIGLKFWEQTKILSLLFSKSLTFSFFLNEQQCSLKEFMPSWGVEHFGYKELFLLVPSK